MTTPLDDPAVAQVRTGYGMVREGLDAIGDDADRRIVRDAMRDALDRDDGLGEGPIADTVLVADSYPVEATIHEGPRFEVLRLRQRDSGTLHALKCPNREGRGDPLARRLLLSEAQA